MLFKKFAGIDVFDIEIDETDPKKFIEIVRPLEPTFGGINLEDIKAPECFEIEEALRERMKIPVFHDDQHGTAIIVGAAVLNGLELSGKKIEDVKICTSGAGAAAIACLNILLALGAKLENIWVADKDGLLTYRRNDVNDKWRGKFCRHDSEATTLAEVFDGADIFLGLSAAGRAEARNAAADGAQSAGAGARQPDARNHAGGGQGAAPRRHGVHRALGLFQPGQQRPLLPLHLPRRARCRRHRDQRGDEARRRPRHRQAGA